MSSTPLAQSQKPVQPFGFNFIETEDTLPNVAYTFSYSESLDCIVIIVDGHSIPLATLGEPSLATFTETKSEAENDDEIRDRLAGISFALTVTKAREAPEDEGDNW